MSFSDIPKSLRPLQATGPQTSRVGHSRTPFGTRVTRRILCSRCGKDDHVAFSPRNAAKALCQSCAAEVLKIYDVGTRIPAETRQVACNLCHNSFSLSVKVIDDGDLLCPDCYKGFTNWQGKIDASPEERQSQRAQSVRTSARTVIRKGT